MIVHSNLHELIGDPNRQRCLWTTEIVPGARQSPMLHAHLALALLTRATSPAEMLNLNSQFTIQRIQKLQTLTDQRLIVKPHENLNRYMSSVNFQIDSSDEVYKKLIKLKLH